MFSEFVTYIFTNLKLFCTVQQRVTVMPTIDSENLKKKSSDLC